MRLETMSMKYGTVKFLLGLRRIKERCEKGIVRLGFEFSGISGISGTHAPAD